MFKKIKSRLIFLYVIILLFPTLASIVATEIDNTYNKISDNKFTYQDLGPRQENIEKTRSLHKIIIYLENLVQRIKAINKSIIDPEIEKYIESTKEYCINTSYDEKCYANLEYVFLLLIEAIKRSNIKTEYNETLYNELLLRDIIKTYENTTGIKEVQIEKLNKTSKLEELDNKIISNISRTIRNIINRKSQEFLIELFKSINTTLMSIVSRDIYNNILLPNLIELYNQTLKEYKEDNITFIYKVMIMKDLLNKTISINAIVLSNYSLPGTIYIPETRMYKVNGTIIFENKTIYSGVFIIYVESKYSSDGIIIIENPPKLSQGEEIHCNGVIIGYLRNLIPIVKINYTFKK